MQLSHKYSLHSSHQAMAQEISGLQPLQCKPIAPSKLDKIFPKSIVSAAENSGHQDLFNNSLEHRMY